jgi:hypothetical protein
MEAGFEAGHGGQARPVIDDASKEGTRSSGVAGAEHVLAHTSTEQGREAPAQRHLCKALLCGAMPGLRRSD